MLKVILRAGLPVKLLALCPLLALACDATVEDPALPNAGSGSGSTGGGSAGTTTLSGGSGGGGGFATSGSGGATAGGTSGGTGGSVTTAGTSAGGSSAGTSSSGGTSGPGSDCVNDTTVKTGHLTWYEILGPAGACAYPYASTQFYGAMNEEDYRAASACGTCVRVSALGKTLDIKIIDLCPVQGNEQWCYNGGHHIDLSPDAFAYFAPKEQGVIDPATWQYIPCEVTGGMNYSFKAESSQYWAEILLDNFPYELTKLEYQNGGAFTEVPRMDYNWFQAGTGMGTGPYTFRVTDLHGNVVTEPNVPLSPGGNYQGTGNFPMCNQ